MADDNKKAAGNGTDTLNGDDGDDGPLDGGG